MANWLGLEGRVVIVTGGASGIANHVVTTLKAADASDVSEKGRSGRICRLHFPKQWFETTAFTMKPSSLWEGSFGHNTPLGFIAE